MDKIYRFISYALALIAVILLVLALGGYYLVTHRAMPQVQGEILLADLSAPVQVIRDQWSVPHIQAENRKDLYMAVGYCQAQDRLFQMDLLRRIAGGRLAEVFGDVQQNIEADRYARVIGFERVARTWLEHLPDQSREALQAYAKGVNQYIELSGKTGLPSEFSLLGYTPELWQPEDSMSIALLTGFGLCSDWTAELLRLGLMQERGEEIMWQLVPRYNRPGPTIIQTPKKSAGLHHPKTDMLKTAAVPATLIHGLLDLESRLRGMTGLIPVSAQASNSWVVDGTLSASGKPILSNDPHLELTLPSVWWEMHLQTPELDVIGVTFPGLPVVVLGHTREIAWAATTTTADTEDIFLEKLNPQNPNQYLFNERWENFEIISETIPALNIDTKELSDIDLTIKLSRHGPIINDILDPSIKSDYALALCWTAREPADPIAAFEGVALAQNWFQFRQAIQLLGVPVQNWLYADQAGHIGYIAAGHLPVRPGHDGTTPVPGWTDQFEWTGYVALDDLPQVLDPPEHYIITANNQVTAPELTDYTISFNYAAPYRAARILELLQGKSGLTADDMASIQGDTHSLHAQKLMPIFISVLEKLAETDHQAELAMRHLKDWDYNMDADSPAPTIFNEIYRHTFKQTLADEMAPTTFDRYYREPAAFNLFDQMLQAGDSPFFDDRSTLDVETRDQIIASAFGQSVAWLKAKQGIRISTWTWGTFHSLSLYHPLGRSPEVKDLAYKLQANQGPYELDGGRQTVNKGFFLYDDKPYEVLAGPSMRHIVDLGRVDQARMIITGGQSGHVFNRHYRDQTPLWLKNEYHPMWMKAGAIDENQEGQLKLLPEKNQL